LWFTLPPQQSLLVSQPFSVIPFPCLIFYHFSYATVYVALVISSGRTWILEVVQFIIAIEKIQHLWCSEDKSLFVASSVV